MNENNAIATLLILKHDVVTSNFVNKTRQGEYGRGLNDAIDFVTKTIDNKLQEYLNEAALK